MKKLFLVISLCTGFYSSFNVFAFHFDEKHRIMEAAHATDIAANHLHRYAEAYAHHGGYSEQTALRAIHVFAERAKHFHKAVEGWTGASHLRRDFYTLQTSFYQVERTFHYLHADSHVTRDYFNAEEAMYELQYLANGYDNGHGGDHDDYPHHP